MSSLPPPDRFVAQVAESRPTRGAIPVVAALAPLAIALGVWAVTGSPMALLFGALGPLLATATLVDGRIRRRRDRRRQHQRLQAELDRVADGLRLRADRERQRLATLSAPAGAEAGTGGEDPADGSVRVRLGTGDLPDAVELELPDPVPEGLEARVAELRDAAARLTDAPVVVDARAGIGVLGPAAAARSLARAVSAQLRARGVPDGAVGVDWSDGRAPLAPELGVRVRLDGVPRIERPAALASITRFRPGYLSSAQRRRADRTTENREAAALPELVTLHELVDPTDESVAPAPATGLTAPVGRDAAGVVCLDLVTQGPHALVAGTTGSGKSELLVTWVLAMAARYAPDHVGFLLVDFKGGAAFAPLAGLPHVVATLSDLDERLAARAVASLRAELRRRERMLAEQGVREIEELPAGALARLVVVVDEFAAVVGEHPELHPVFADLAARGRSLGLHLVLCTQRPAGVVRDVVLANVTLRIALRVTDRHDSTAVIGTDAAVRLPLEPRGRAVVTGLEGGERLVQFAIASRDDVERIRDRLPAGAGPERTWRDPLPPSIPWSTLPVAPGANGLAFGLADLPDEQRQPVAAHDPARHGALLVLGAGASGKSTALRALAASADRAGLEVTWLPAHPADAWPMLTEGLARRGSSARPALLVIDDLDALLARFDADHRAEAAELVTRLARERSRTGLSLIASAHSLATSLAPVAAAFGSRLLLRLASRDEHLLAGGDAVAYDPAARPGSGCWRGSVVQVAVDAPRLAARAADPLPTVELSAGSVTAIAAGRPEGLRARLSDAGARVLDVAHLGAAPPADALEVARADAPLVLLGDPDAWTAAWALLTRARREWPFVFVDCALADYRALARGRAVPPPLGDEAGECWLVHDGVTRRARLAVG